MSSQKNGIYKEYLINTLFIAKLKQNIVCNHDNRPLHPILYTLTKQTLFIYFFF